MTTASRRGKPTGDAPGPRTVAAGGRLAPMIYDLVKERLLEGEYRAGERIAVAGLKTEFGVSKQPIMDALRRLATEGLVEIIPQVGSRVPVYSAQDMADFFAIFGGMEGAVAGVAAQRYQPEQLEELIRVNAAIGELTGNPDPGARSHGYRVLNRQFHGIVHSMAHSEVVSDITRRMWNLSDLLINTGGVPQPLAMAVASRYDDHERVISALRERDRERARAEMEAHIIGTVAVINAGRPDPGQA